ncbi:ATPase, T2SS/T4P/T4SS family [Psychrobacter sp. K31L]|uniref:ATPase, T2SS/T4P/T4SS family n=1 Tax=Psychrobacter sp. K31L TaxID=2820758 RepID=UPI001B33D3FD|nr:ATPase, T2SS/T4P/T4SS family [Psychrobacter sp. K31L]MBP3946757.1 Flp pilus assembly complex ATPase component TadA [Psychrobacter sp. K31L]
MLQIKVVYKDNESVVSFNNTNIIIGKGSDAELQIKGWLISQNHAVIKKLPAGYVIEDLDRGANGTYVNGEKIDLYGPLIEEDVISIGKYLFIIDSIDFEENNKEIESIQAKNKQKESFQDEESHIKLKKHEQVFNSELSNAETIETGMTLFRDNKAQLEKDMKLMKELHKKLVETMDLQRNDISKMSDKELYETASTCLNKIVENDLNISRSNIERIKKLVLNEAVGLGPLECFLADKDVSEIMVNSANEIYIEKKGKIYLSGAAFSSDQAVLDIIERIVSPIGRRIDESSPMVDARLKDGSRVNAIIPPLALKGPTITIRKFPEKRLIVKDLVDMNSVSADMADFLESCVLHKRNIIISGGTGSGKTTLLNVLSNFIPNGERIITIEDAAELKLDHDHLISLESRPANAEGKGSVTIRDLVKNSLRMRPDRIVVGECRGAESLDMLQAMNTGHEGSLTTLHANTPRDALSRLETLVLMAGMDLPLQAIREQIVSAIDIIVQQTRFACGSRKITHITEVTGIEGNTIQLQDIFKYSKSGYGSDGSVQGVFQSTETIPSFYQELIDSGSEVKTDYFNL